MRQAKQKSAEEASALLELLLAAECLIPHKDECSQLVDQLTIEHHEAGTVILAESGDPEPSLYWVSAAAAVLVVLLLLVSRWVVGGWLVGGWWVMVVYWLLLLLIGSGGGAAAAAVLRVLLCLCCVP